MSLKIEKENKFDLVVMDCCIEWILSIDACHRRDIKQLHNTKIIDCCESITVSAVSSAVVSVLYQSYSPRMIVLFEWILL